MVSDKKKEMFSIDLFLHVIEAKAWDLFFDEYIHKDGDHFVSTHPLRLMESYPDFMFDGINTVAHELGEDF